MITKRKYKRYHSSVPIRIVAPDSDFVAFPRDIGLGGCYFDFSKPFDGEVQNAYAVLDENTTIALEKPQILPHEGPDQECRKRDGCFGLKWILKPPEAAKLHNHLENKNNDYSNKEKADFLINEQKILAEELSNIERTKLSRTKVLLTAIAAYLSFFAVPYKVLSPFSNELGGLYAIGGIWISVSLVFYSDRILKFLGTSYKLKGIYFKAMNLNRSIIMRNDASYYSATLFPLGIEYDDARRHPYAPGDFKAGLEKHPADMRYNYFTTFYFIFIQLLFVIGFVYYMSILMGAMQNVSFYQPGNPDKLNMINYTAYQVAFITCSGIILFWIQICITRCEYFQKRIWEAKRANSYRPNPQFSGRKFRMKKYLYWPSKIVQYVVFAYGISSIIYGLNYLYNYRYLKNIFSGRIYRFDFAIILCIAYFLLRWLFSYIKMAEETEADDNARLLAGAARTTAWL